MGQFELYFEKQIPRAEAKMAWTCSEEAQWTCWTRDRTTEEVYGCSGGGHAEDGETDDKSSTFSSIDVMAYYLHCKTKKAKLCSYSHCQNYYRRTRIICDIHIFATPEKGPIFQSETSTWWRVTFLFLSQSAADTESCIFQNPLG